MKYIFILIISIVIFTGCVSSTYTKVIPKGKIQDSNIVITARDGSFTLQGEFKSPFQSSVHYHSYNIGGDKLIKGYKRALQYDAKHVLIKIPSEKKELFGVLVLDKADENGLGPSTKSYKIIIPQPYIDAAKNGKISVVYEYYFLKSEGLIDVSNVKKQSWILWMSDKDIFI